MKKKLIIVSLFLISILFISSCAQMAPTTKRDTNCKFFQDSLEQKNDYVISDVLVNVNGKERLMSILPPNLGDELFTDFSCDAGDGGSEECCFSTGSCLHCCSGDWVCEEL
jgi:hypothetical protein